MEMILNNPGEFVQLEEKNTNVFAHSYSRITISNIDMYALLIIKNQKNLNGENLFQ